MLGSSLDGPGIFFGLYDIANKWSFLSCNESRLKEVESYTFEAFKKPTDLMFSGDGRGITHFKLRR